jgi:hypothetical protein
MLRRDEFGAYVDAPPGRGIPIGATGHDTRMMERTEPTGVAYRLRVDLLDEAGGILATYGVEYPRSISEEAREALRETVSGVLTAICGLPPQVTGRPLAG